MGIFFQVKRVIKKIYGRRRLIANVWKKKSNQPLLILYITDPKTNIRTVQNLIFYLEPDYFIAIRSGLTSFWIKFFTYLVPFRNVTIYPLLSKAKAVKILQTNATYSKDDKFLSIRLIDQIKDLADINVPYYKHPGFCWPVNKQPGQTTGNRIGFIFMAGNVNPELYNHPNFNEKYGIPGRHQVYTFLSGFENAITQGFFSREVNAQQKKIFLHTLAKNNLPQDKYIQYLQQFNCVICAPGVAMPLCHNIIEAMEYGCIPIFSYPDWLPAGLEHGVNCFIYKSLPQLEVIIQGIDKLQEEDFNRMRYELERYYKQRFINYKPDLNNNNELVILNENKQMLDL